MDPIPVPPQTPSRPDRTGPRRRWPWALLALTAGGAALVAGFVNGCSKDQKLDQVEAAGPLVRFEPPNARLVSSTTTSAKPGIAGQPGVARVLRTFEPSAGVSLDAVMGSFDEEANRLGLAVETHERGHCTTEPAEGGAVVHVWLADADAGEVRYRATFDGTGAPASELCTKLAGPPRAAS